MIELNGQKESELRALLLKVDQVALMLGLSERTVWRLVETGEIPRPIKLGRSVRWSRSTIERFVTQRAEEVAVTSR
jgi:excisionase family DNA binding protein